MSVLLAVLLLHAACMSNVALILRGYGQDLVWKQSGDELLIFVMLISNV